MNFNEGIKIYLKYIKTNLNLQNNGKIKTTSKLLIFYLYIEQHMTNIYNFVWHIHWCIIAVEISVYDGKLMYFGVECWIESLKKKVENKLMLFLCFDLQK